MITQNTVFVLGAGASHPYGFPLGRQLRNKVMQRTAPSSRRQWAELLKDLQIGRSEIAQFHRGLAESQLPSVDWFVERRPEFLRIGKAAIALGLIPCEQPEKAVPRGGAPHWYGYLYSKMDTPLEEFGDNQVTFVTFNYDRSLEYFLVTALKATHGISRDKAAEVVSRIGIIHVHGRLGPLPWDAPEGVAPRMFEPAVSADALTIAMKHIVIMPEVEEGSEGFARAQTALRSADRIYFLGFGYHEKNLERLGVQHCDKGQLAGGTAYAMRWAQRQEVYSRWRIPIRLAPNRARKHIEDYEVLSFLQEFVF